MRRSTRIHGMTSPLPHRFDRALHPLSPVIGPIRLTLTREVQGVVCQG